MVVRVLHLVLDPDKLKVWLTIMTAMEVSRPHLHPPRISLPLSYDPGRCGGDMCLSRLWTLDFGLVVEKSIMDV